VAGNCKDNHRSGIALAMRRTGHASQTLVVLHLRAQGLGEGDEHPPMLSLLNMVNFTFTVQVLVEIILFALGDFSVLQLGSGE